MPPARETRRNRDATPTNPPETITLLVSPTPGAEPITQTFPVFLERGTGKRLMECNLCGHFYTLTGRSPGFLSARGFTTHRTRGTCEDTVRRRAHQEIEAQTRREEREALRIAFGWTPGPAVRVVDRTGRLRLLEDTNLYEETAPVESALLSHNALLQNAIVPVDSEVHVDNGHQVAEKVTSNKQVMPVRHRTGSDANSSKH
ncbi:hypothetical protein H0H81_010650 [Sphagnurus paluster]|uniref:Uncharacterized protein n=1 Tax=Sphagnurus paluster TaxID=117069 RepID=A0A9P7GHW8_9AGAR|nr:hypothetical protein H0H81_010650 [Sphagnurus paluster]